MEVCVDSLKSLQTVLCTPASRVELCSSLAEGGLTPSLGFHSLARELRDGSSGERPLIFPIIRHRSGDFLYSQEEVSLMKRDILGLLPADGFVIGCLSPDGGIDVQSCKELIGAARSRNPYLPITFHRAFDMCKDPFEAVPILLELGINRILTSGSHPNAYEGRFLIRDLVKAFPDMIFMAGGGINKDNLRAILETTRIKEFHASARSPLPSQMEFRNTKCSMGSKTSSFDEYSTLVASESKIKELIGIQHSLMNM